MLGLRFNYNSNKPLPGDYGKNTNVRSNNTRIRGAFAFYLIRLDIYIKLGFDIIPRENSVIWMMSKVVGMKRDRGFEARCELSLKLWFG